MQKSALPSLRVLPNLPAGRISFSPNNLQQDVASFTRDLLASKGQASGTPGFFENRAVATLARAAEPEIQRLIDRHGPELDTRLAARAVDRTQFRMDAKKTDRRAWLVSGAIFFGALLGFAAAGYGIGLGFKHFFSPAVAEGIQAGWNPVWYTVGGGIVGACTSLFNDKVTSPVRAWINRMGFKGAPVQANEIKSLTDELIFANMVENTADGRFNGGRFALTVYLIDSERSFATAAKKMREARAAKSPEEKQAALEAGAFAVAAQLINDELFWFNFDPHNQELFDYVQLRLAPAFGTWTQDEITTFREMVLGIVRDKRKKVQSEGRPELEAAIKDYYGPYLDRVFNLGPKPEAQQQAQNEAPALVAHAG